MRQQTWATVQIEGTAPFSLDQEPLTPEAVARLLRGLRDERDVTVSVQPQGLDERLLVAVDGTLAFLGMERPDGLFQFSQSDAGSTTRAFTIGGQEADIESRYLVDLEVAAIVVQEWLLGGEQSSVGVWERQ